jgi:hypothetical protein
LVNESTVVTSKFHTLVAAVNEEMVAPVVIRVSDSHRTCTDLKKKKKKKEARL